MYKKAVFLMMIGAAFAFGKAMALGIQIGPSKPALDLQTRNGLEVTPVVQRVLPKPVALDQFEAAWRAWMVAFDVKASSIAIGRQGKILRSRGAKRSPSTSFPMASLSKSITAHCLNTFLEESPYDWDSTLAEMTPILSRLNLTPGAAMLDKTLTQFATHTSGLPKKLIQGKASLRKKHLDSQASMTRTALKVPQNFNVESGFAYSNANYAILGSLISAMSGRSYSEVCKDRIMTPAGARNANVSGQMARTAGYGGWMVSVEDYARYAMHWFAPDAPWVLQRENYAYDPNTGYGLGAYARNMKAGGVSFHHGGSWRHNDRRKANLGSFFIVAADGTTIVVNWDKWLSSEAYSYLFTAISQHL